MSALIEKTWTDVLAAVHGHHKGLVDEGHVDPERLRLTVAARKETVIQLKIKGLSNRQIAAAVGASEGTIRNDLAAQNYADNAQSCAPIEVSEKDILDVAKEIRGKQQADKKAARETREAELGAKQTALPDKKYGVIYGDPPSRLEPYSRESGMDRAADNHYPTMSFDEIKALTVPAAPDCVLFLWATVPMLPQALDLMAAWGFAYKSHCVWAKDRIGTGYWFRNKHELLLIGTRGSIPAPTMGTQWPSLIEAPVGKHSAKPACFLEMIDAYFPSLPKIELFRRGPARAGWDAWGNEAEAPPAIREAAE